jgi:hypothetical protein
VCNNPSPQCLDRVAKDQERRALRGKQGRSGQYKAGKWMGKKKNGSARKEENWQIKDETYE